MFISKKDLSCKNVLKKSKYSIIYDLGNDILAKEFINLDATMMYFKRQKIYFSGEFQNIPNIAVPIDTLETEEGVVGYLMKRQPGMVFVDYFNASPDRLNLGIITDYVYNTEVILKECHEHDLFFPDLASSNILYDPVTGKVYIIDYDGAQIKDIKECSLSSFIAPFRVIHSQKYLPNGVYDSKIDIFTLATRYFYYTTKINLNKMRVDKGDVKEIINCIGLRNTQFGDLLLRVFDYEAPNEYIGEAIQELKKNYTLSPHIIQQPRIFIKK